MKCNSIAANSQIILIRLRLASSEFLSRIFQENMLFSVNDFGSLKGIDAPGGTIAGL